jgi:hypothetical protein
MPRWSVLLLPDARLPLKSRLLLKWRLKRLPKRKPHARLISVAARQFQLALL